MWRIDSSLFFDDDGRCYFMANSLLQGEKSPTVPSRRRILLQELNIKTAKLIGVIHEIGRGAYVNSVAVAALPHRTTSQATENPPSGLKSPPSSNLPWPKDLPARVSLIHRLGLKTEEDILAASGHRNSLQSKSPRWQSAKFG
jgi:hypothetical protein